MPLISGTNPASVSVRYRFAIIVISIFFFYSYHSVQKTLDDVISERDSKINTCELKAISVSEKLKVIWDHKQKIEQRMGYIKIKIDSNNEKLVEKEAKLIEITTKFETCQSKLEEMEKTKLEKVEKNKVTLPEGENQELKNRISELETLLKDKEIENRENVERFQEEIKKYEETIKQTAGGGAVDHYTQNKTANFQRNHKADEPLSFDRGKIQHHAPSRLLHGKELAKTLEDAKRKKQEEENVHPQDRNMKDNEVNEVPNKEEQDYKEH